MRRLLTVVFCFHLFVGIAIASTTKTYPISRFRIGEVKLAMKTPKGFCAPTGLDLAQADALSRADERNLTVANLLACNRNPTVSPWSNYVLIKAPKFAIHTTVPKSDSLAQLDIEMQEPKDPNLDRKLTESIANSTEKNLGTRVEMQMEWQYSGRDADCVYMSGPIRGKTDLSGRSGQLATCMTVVGGRFFAVHLYEFPATSSLEALKAQVHRIATSVHP